MDSWKRNVLAPSFLGEWLHAEKLQLLMAFVTLLTYALDVLDGCDANQAVTYLMSTSHRDEDCLSFMLEECVCLDAMAKF